jgi:hypothetical protein
LTNEECSVCHKYHVELSPEVMKLLKQAQIETNAKSINDVIKDIIDAMFVTNQIAQELKDDMYSLNGHIREVIQEK